LDIKEKRLYIIMSWKAIGSVHRQPRLDIDHENLTITREFVKDREVIVIDNFYKFPHDIIRYYHTANKIVTPTYYPGTRVQLIPKIKNPHIEDFWKLMHTKHFVTNPREWKKTGLPDIIISKYNDTYDTDDIKHEYIQATANPHWDTVPDGTYNMFVGVCYLSKKNHGGTGIYKNRELNFFSTNQINLELLNEKKIFPYEKKRVINKSCDKFELLKLLPMKFNRLVLYDGDLLHSMYIEDPEFFKHIDRITTNYTMPVYMK
tara:strand:+ start:456 stop:1238 length:783 start_codon:yes stop_codon:yes gene_type:complete